MTAFSQRLGAFFARTASFAELEAAADAVVRDGDDVDHALNIIDRHLRSGRLPEVLHRALSERLMGRVAPADGRRETTTPFDDAALPDQIDDRTSEIPRRDAAPVTAADYAHDDPTTLMKDQTSKLESLVPDAAELDGTVDLPSPVATAAADSGRTANEPTALMQDHTARLESLVPDRTEFLSDPVADDAARADATMALETDASPTTTLGDERGIAADVAAVDVAAGDATRTIRQTASGRPEDSADVTATRVMGDATTPAADATAALASPVEDTAALPAASGSEVAEDDRTAEVPAEQSPGYERTVRVNRHVAPTVRIGAGTEAPYEKTRRIEDVTRPDAQRAETQPIADVPKPVPPRPDQTLPIDRVPPPPADRTLPIEQVPKPELDDPDKTEAVGSGVFPSGVFPTGTGSNWLNPEQWSERHTGPIVPGVVLKRRFLIERQLGRGGMGVVFKARDKRKDEASDRDPFVAIKVLNDNYRDHPQALMALQRESRKAQTLAHPNIVTVYDFDRDGTTVYMTMELMRGEPLDVLLRRRKAEGEDGVDVDLARRVIREMAAGLAYAHKLDIVHSDFKPGNVFLTEDERVKILDFGIARARVYSGPQATDSEQTLFDAGDLSSLTPGYAALEMFRREDPHPADDVYALAITAYLLLTGRHPFDRKTSEEVEKLGLEPEPIKFLKRHEWAAIQRGLALKREDRTQDAATFLREFAGRRKATRWVTAAMLVLAAAAGYFAYTSFQDPGPAIAWSELSAAQQSSFREHVASGEAWLANDPPWIGGAYNDFAAAWEIHPRNPDAVRGLDAVAGALIALAPQAESAADRRRLLEDIDTASDNEYLKEHRGLRTLRRELAARVEAGR